MEGFAATARASDDLARHLPLYPPASASKLESVLFWSLHSLATEPVPESPDAVIDLLERWSLVEERHTARVAAKAASPRPACSRSASFGAAASDGSADGCGADGGRAGFRSWLSPLRPSPSVVGGGGWFSVLTAEEQQTGSPRGLPVRDLSSSSSASGSQPGWALPRSPLQAAAFAPLSLFHRASASRLTLAPLS